MGRTRNTLTPLIGLSLAALVAGSLVTLAVLAQRVSLDIPLGSPVLPRRPQPAASAPPLVVENPPPAQVADLPRQRDVNAPPDRVLPLRISEPAAPAPGKDGKPGKQGGKGKGPRRPGDRRATIGLPPGIIKKINRGGELPPGHATRAAAGAKRYPGGSAKGRGRGVCGEPPCGNGAVRHSSTASSSPPKSRPVRSHPGKGKGKR